MSGTFFQHPSYGGRQGAGHIVADANTFQNGMRRQCSGDCTAKSLDGVPDLVARIVRTDTVRIALWQENALKQSGQTECFAKRNISVILFERNANDIILI